MGFRISLSSLSVVVFAAILIISSLGTAVAGTIRVPADQPTIQDAIDVAVDGDIVLVAPGTYVENINFLGKPITVTSESGSEVTIIDGGNFGTVVTFNNGEGLSSVLRNFAIKNGSANFGAGVSILGASPTIVGNIFENNNQLLGGFGAGIGGNVSSAVVVGNIFRNNDCDNQFIAGVIAFVNSSSPLVANNILEDNICRAININPTEGNTPEILNNTIIGNRVGIRVDRRIDSFLYLFANNIIVGNEIGLEVDFGTEAFNPTWQNNLVFGNDIDYEIIADQTGINGNISADPLFADEPAGDYRLLFDSPAVDAGDNTVPNLPATDIDGGVRIVDGDGDGVAVVDMGAFEFPGVVADAGPDQTVSDVESVNLDGTGSFDPGGTNLTFVWSIDGSEIATGPTPTVGPFTIGEVVITLTVTDEDGHTASDTMVVTVVDNLPPIANAGGPYAINEGSSLVLDASGSTDPDGNATIASFLWDLDNDGQFDDATGVNPTISPAQLTALGLPTRGPRSFPIALRVSDDGGLSAVDTTTVNVLIVSPVATDDLVSLPKGKSTTIDVLANDMDPFGAGLSVTATGPAINGTVTLNPDDTVTYSRNGNFKNGCDKFTYAILDGRGRTDQGLVQVAVGSGTCGPGPGNSPPVADDQAVSTPKDTPVAITLTASDANGDALTFAIVTGPTDGALSGTAPNVTYTPNAGFIGTDSFSFKANDGTVDSNIATVTIEVTAVPGATGTLKGTVTKDGKRISGASVRLDPGTASERQVTTNKAGKYIFDSVPAGSHSITATAGVCGVGPFPVLVTAGQTFSYDLLLVCP